MPQVPAGIPVAEVRLTPERLFAHWTLVYFVVNRVSQLDLRFTVKIVMPHQGRRKVVRKRGVR